VGLDYIVEKTDLIEDPDNLVVVSPDAGGVYRARHF
jgi:ribose-phosphate pyrophosphokinase